APVDENQTAAGQDAGEFGGRTAQGRFGLCISSRVDSDINPYCSRGELVRTVICYTASRVGGRNFGRRRGDEWSFAIGTRLGRARGGGDDCFARQFSRQ